MEEKVIVWEGKNYKECKASGNRNFRFCGPNANTCACAFFRDEKACDAHLECLDKGIYYEEIK